MGTSVLFSIKINSKERSRAQKKRSISTFKGKTLLKRTIQITNMRVIPLDGHKYWDFQIQNRKHVWTKLFKEVREEMQ